MKSERERGRERERGGEREGEGERGRERERERERERKKVSRYDDLYAEMNSYHYQYIHILH